MKEPFHNDFNALLKVSVPAMLFGILMISAINARYAGSAGIETPFFRIDLNGQPHD